MPNKASDNALTLLKSVEGVRLKAYQDGGGVWTIGYGHTGPDVVPGLVISQQRAEELLALDVKKVEDVINSMVKVALTQNQYDALTSFIFNIGGKQFSTSTMLRLINQGQFVLAKDQFARWKYDNGKEVQGLVNRRAKEAELFGK